MKITTEKLISSTNIADLLADDELDRIGRQVVEDFQRDKDSRKEWETRSEEAMKLALQVVEDKSFPWNKASNVKYPLLTLAAVQFAARVDLFPGSEIVKLRVNGFDSTGQKQDRAIRIMKHMSYQLTSEMSDWSEDNDRLFHALPIIGTMFKKTYFDPVTGHNCSEVVYPLDLVFDYWAKKVDDCHRKTHILNLRPNQIVEKQRRGIFREVDLTASRMQEERKLSELIEGTTVYDDDNAPRVILECHCLWDLDNDGYQEPYIVTVDRDSEQVLRIVARYDRESITYGKSKREIACIEPDEYFTQFNFIPDPNGGNLGLGLGHLLGPINESVNTLINQLIDAGTLSNLQGGFIGKGLRIKAGKLTFQPGEWKFVQSTGDDLNKNIVPMPVREPSAVLFNLLHLLVSAGERVGSVTDAITGENPPTNQPATTTLATIEQGLKVFKRVHRRLYDSFSKEFKKLFKLNRRYLKPEEYFSVLDVPPQQMQKLLPITQALMQQQGQMMAMQTDYQAVSDDLTPSADPNVMTTEEKYKKVEALMQTQGLFQWPVPEVKKRFVETLDFPNPDALLVQGPPPPPPPEVLKIQQDGQIKQAEMQLEAQKMQIEQQIKEMENQLKQQQMALEAKKLEAEVEKVQMDVVKVEAEIRKILAEIEAMGESADDRAIEVQRLGLEQQKLQLEAQMKQQELQLKNKELETNNDTQRYINDTKNQKDTVLQLSKMISEVHDKVKESSGPKKVNRDGNGLITGIGTMKVIRDERGNVVGLEPTEMSEDAAQEELDNGDTGNVSGTQKKKQIRTKADEAGKRKAKQKSTKA